MFGIRDRTGRRFARRTSLRTSIALLAFGPGLVLAGLGGYAASGLFAQGLQLRADTELARSVGTPVQEVLASLQEERRLTAVWRAKPSSSARALQARRKKTDAAIEAYRRQAGAALDGASARVASQARALRDALAELPGQRAAIDSRDLSQAGSFGYYTEAITHGNRLMQALSRSAGGRLAHGVAAVAALGQIGEMVAREDTLVSVAAASGRMSPATRREFAGYVATQRAVRNVRVAGQLPPQHARAYERLTTSPHWNEMVSIEDSVITDGSALPARADEWRNAVDRTSGDLRKLGADALGSVLDGSSARVEGLLLRASAGSAVGLLALALSAALTARLARSFRRRLSALRGVVQDADARLPELAGRVERGEDVELADEVEQPDFGTDEVGQLAADVAGLRQTAENTVVQQVQGREGTTKVLVNLARRTQVLVHREISMLDAMERTYEEPDLLEKLFAVDHTATRVRRHAENLLLLGGSLVPPGRDDATPLVDVLRSAVSETEDYLRVTMGAQSPRVSLIGAAGKDVIHLVAELVENGTSFSPPHTKTEVRAEEVPNGLVIEVEDRGLGMKPEDYQYHNERLASPPAPDKVLQGEDARLGLFVVARLAHRHGIEVSLVRSRYGGTRAIVLLPKALLTKPAPAEGVLPGLPTGARVVGSASEPDTAPRKSAGARHQHPVDTVDTADTADAQPGTPSTAPDPLSSMLSSGFRPIRSALDRESGQVEPDSRPEGKTEGQTEPGTQSRAEPEPHPPPEPQAPATAAQNGQAGPARPAGQSGQPGQAGPPAEPPGEPPGEPPAAPDTPGEHSPEEPVTERGLPKRMRGTNLVRQLREPSSPPQPGSNTDESSPEQISDALAAIQRGTVQAQADPACDPDSRADAPGQAAPDVSPQTKDERNADADPG